VYEAVAAGKPPANPSYPTFADGYRELLICERILESNKKQSWIKV
jgi:predicted dehydrogenase